MVSHLENIDLEDPPIVTTVGVVKVQGEPVMMILKCCGHQVVSARYRRFADGPALEKEAGRFFKRLVEDALVD